MDGSVALYLRDDKALHVLNPAAELLFHCLDRPTSLDDLVGLVSELTNAARETVRRDLAEALPDLERRGIVERR